MRRGLRLALNLWLVLVNLALSACAHPPEQPEPPEPKSQGVSFDLHTALTKLERIGNYYSEFDVSWDGVRDGVPISGQLAMERVQARDSAAQEIFATVRLGESGERDTIAFVQIGDQGWFYHQGQAGTWRETSGRALEDYTDETFFTPEAFFGDFDLWIAVPISPSPERVSGVLAYEYGFDAHNLTSDSMEFRHAQGYVAVSAEGGHLVELVMTADVDCQGAGCVLESGELQVTFEVSNIGRPATVEPPRITRADIPLPSDVTLPDPTPIPLSQRQDRTPTSDRKMTYQTQASTAEVADLYQTAMPEHGWETLTYDIPFDQAGDSDPARLQYVKGDEGVAITVKDEQGTRSVRLGFESAGDMKEDLCHAITRCSVLVLTDFPTSPDAEVGLFVSGGGIEGQLHYETTCSVDEMVAFYTTVMPADGWSEAVLADYTPQAGTRALGYVKGNKGVGIFIKEAQGVTQVMVKSGPAVLTVWDYPNVEDLQIARDFPVVPDARKKGLLPGQLRYLTRYNVAEVLRFYENALPDDGWTAKPGGVDSAQTAILRYEKDMVTATLMAREDSGGSIVWITLYRRKEGQPQE